MQLQAADPDSDSSRNIPHEEAPMLPHRFEPLELMAKRLASAGSGDRSLDGGRVHIGGHAFPTNCFCPGTRCQHTCALHISG